LTVPLAVPHSAHRVVITHPVAAPIFSHLLVFSFVVTSAVATSDIKSSVWSCTGQPYELRRVNH
jgi:hypothetical protein